MFLYSPIPLLTVPGRKSKDNILVRDEGPTYNQNPVDRWPFREHVEAAAACLVGISQTSTTAKPADQINKNGHNNPRIPIML